MTIEQAVEILEGHLIDFRRMRTSTDPKENPFREDKEALILAIGFLRSYIGTKGLPEKREEKAVAMSSSPADMALWSGGFTSGFNQALHLCKLAVMKEYVRKDKIEVGVKPITFSKAGDSYCKGKKEDLPSEDE